MEPKHIKMPEKSAGSQWQPIEIQVVSKAIALVSNLLYKAIQ